MAYVGEHRAGDKDAPLQLQTSAMTWQALASGRVRPAPAPRLGYGDAVILPVFNRFKAMGVDDSFGLLSDPDPFGSSGADYVGISAPAEAANVAAAADYGAYSSYFQPSIASAGALTPGSVAYNAVQDAGSSYKTPGTPAYNALLSAGLSAAQIAKTVAAPGQPVIAAPGAAAAPVVSSASMVPGLSNSTILIVGVIGLIFLASGKKR